ncbi:MAG: Rieske 2Fe-2S domain-containing protein [Myxococcota bacterium]
MTAGDFVDVLASDELPEGGRRVVTVAGRKVALVRVQGRAFAVDNACPHRDGELGLGALEGHHLSCPKHAWCFDVRDGRAFFPPGVAIACFEVREEAARLSVSPHGRKAAV